MLESYYHINKAAGISIHLLSDGKALIHICSVNVDGKKLEINKKITGLEDTGKITGHLSPKSYVALNIFGKGVLQKRIGKTVEISSNTFNQLLPNANLNDFYIQNFISGDSSFVCIIRKADADKWIDIIKDLGLVPLSLSLGPFPVQNIMPQLNVYGEEMVFDGHIIKRHEDDWKDVKYNADELSPFPLKIESETINEKLLIPYAIAFQLVLAERINLIRAEVPALTADLKKTIDNKKLQVKGVVILGAFFIALLINFFTLSYFNSQNNKLTNQLNSSNQSASDLENISEQVKTKEALLKNLGWDNGINKSRLVDQLASLLPGDISWQQISVNPLDQSTGQTPRTVQFKDGRIKITGNSQNIIPVNEWIARIKSLKWVKEVELDNYTYNSELNTGQFIVIIDY